MARQTRAANLADEVGERELDALLITNLTNLRWLTGFAGTNGAAVCGPNRRLFLTDFRYTEMATALLEGWDVETVSGDWLVGIAARLKGLATAGSSLRIGIEDDHLTVRELRRLQKALTEAGGPELELVEVGGTVEKLRRVKDEAEQAGIARAAELCDEIYSETVERGLGGRSERDVARFALALMRERGAEPSFPPIVAAGPNGALPHATPSDRVIQPGEMVVFDMGVELDGLCSDCTRTFAVGELSEEETRVYATALKAQEAAVLAVRAGAEGKAVDAVAREIISTAGYGENFGHGLGHGVGLEVHEAPRLSPLSKDTLLVGEVVTVEPGIYLPGKFGVRIEDLLVVTAEGSRNLSGLPKALTIVS